MRPSDFPLYVWKPLFLFFFPYEVSEVTLVPQFPPYLFGLGSGYSGLRFVNSHRRPFQKDVFLLTTFGLEHSLFRFSSIWHVRDLSLF